MKRIEELWDDLDKELSEAGESIAGGAILTRLATPESDQRLRVGMEWPSRARVLLFYADATTVPPKTSWPECQGLELMLDTSSGGRVTLIVRLRDLRGKDVFTALAEDLAKRAIGGSEPEAARRVLAALARWQRFLATKGRSLSEEGRRGLWGELKIMEDLMVPSIGIEAAINAWRGPIGAPQDFQISGVAIEVKTRASRSPAAVRISGEQQLHDEPWRDLFLAHLAVDEQEGAGETLPERIRAVRQLAMGTAAAELLEDSLLEVGWLEAEEEKHRSRGFIVRELEYFKVVDGFPRLTPPILPSGIGGLAYDLSLDAAMPFVVLQDAVCNALEPEI